MNQAPAAGSGEVVLALANVESSYGPIKAIRGVSLKVRRGEIVTVLGSNGAGKSTILKTISGIIDPNRGSVSYKGENITAQDPALIVQRGLMHVPEGREVVPLLSVRDNLPVWIRRGNCRTRRCGWPPMRSIPPIQPCSPRPT